jgi:hypothetical protein
MDAVVAAAIAAWTRSHGAAAATPAEGSAWRRARQDRRAAMTFEIEVGGRVRDRLRGSHRRARTGAGSSGSGWTASRTKWNPAPPTSVFAALRRDTGRGVDVAITPPGAGDLLQCRAS